MNKIVRYIALALLSISFQFCSLDTKLYENISSESAYSSVQDVQNGMNGAYQQFGYYTFYGMDVPAVSDMITDVSEASASSGHLVSINQWTFSETDSYLDEIWSAGYTVIDRCVRGINGGLALINNAEAKNISSSDVHKLHAYIAQMYALRAMSDLVLVNMYGLPYQSGSDNSQLGIVVVSTAPIKEFTQVTRSTVGQTYNQILADIDSAKVHINILSTDEKAAINQYYFNEAAIYALEARTKLYMQDYDGAKVAAQKALDLRASGDETFESYVAMWKSTAITKEDIFTIVKSDNDNLSSNSLNTLYGSYDASISAFTKAKFDTTDIRLGLISGTHPGKFDGTATSQSVSNIPVFRKSEMYLIIAEASLKGSTVDLNAAKNALFYTAQRNKAITSVADLPSTKADLISFVSAERVREFFQEGHRYFDLRRTGETASINGVDNYQISKFVFPIPSDEINSGFGVVQNENWADAIPSN